MPSQIRPLNISSFQAAVFDLDGVVTDTARLHARAWKELFEGYLGQPFSIEEDYLRFIDGKPRYAGVESFLRSRGLELALGSETDSEDTKTICGLGNRKNALYRELLDREGPLVYETTLTWISALQGFGLRLALVSASRNCRDVLERAGLRDLFPVVIDGVVASERKLPGKPDPATFLEAVRELGALPEESIAIEDAISGIEAAARGQFGLVVGIARKGGGGALRAAGADAVVSDLSELEPIARPRDARSLQCNQPIFFLDYDGTLAPIEERPELATLDEETRKLLDKLSKQTLVAVISGRDLKDVRALVDLDRLYYAGSHGFDVCGPGGLSFVYEEALPLAPLLEQVAAQLQEHLKEIPGALLERKRFSLAVHFRLCLSEAIPKIEQAVEEAMRPRLRRRRGKMILEISPDLPWDKGRAVLWLLERLGIDAKRCQPIYIGDDTTDEDAFKVLIDRGIGIAVTAAERPTLAAFSLQDTEAVHRFLKAHIHE